MDDGLPDVVELLTTDHERIAALLEAGDRWAAVRELSQHLVAEDQLVYPPIRQFLDIDDLVDGWLDRDRSLEVALLEVDKEETTALNRVAELFVAHRRDQEGDAFVRMRAGIDRERLVALGDALAEVVRTAPTHPHPHNPDEGVFQIVADAISGEIDEIRDAYHEGRGDRS